MSAAPLPPTNSCDSLLQVCRVLQSRPVYAQVRRVGGEDHRPLFQTEVHVAPLGYSTQGSGPSKSIARRSAAAAMLDFIKSRHPDLDSNSNDGPHFYVDREPDHNLERDTAASPSRVNSHAPTQDQPKPPANLPRISPLSVTQSDPRPIPPTDAASLRNPSLPDSHALPRINRRPLSLPPKQPFTGGVVQPPHNPHYATLDQVYSSNIQPPMPPMQHASQPVPHPGFAPVPSDTMMPDTHQAHVRWNGMRSSPVAPNLPVQAQAHQIPFSQPALVHPAPNPTTPQQPLQFDGGYVKQEDRKLQIGSGNKDMKAYAEGGGNDDGDAWREDGELRESEEERANHEALMAPAQPNNNTAEVRMEAHNLTSEKARGGEVEGPNGKEVQKAANGTTQQQLRSTDATQAKAEPNQEAAAKLERGVKGTTTAEFAAKPSEAIPDGVNLGVPATQQAGTERPGSSQTRLEQISGEAGVLVRNPHPPRKWRSEQATLRVAAGAAKRTRASQEALVLTGHVEEEELEGGDGAEAIPLRKRSRPAVEKVVRKHWGQLSSKLKLTIIAELGVGWIREQVIGLMEQGLFIEVMLVAVGGADTGFGLWDCVKGVTKVSPGKADAGMVLVFECGKWLERVWVERGRFLADNDGGSAALCPRMLVICESAKVRSLVEKAGVVDVLDKESMGVATFVAGLLEVAKQGSGRM
eukprot:GFKZ01012470.1.p1 GENE.GFKZ01012470.1~~GFKZ01012470.1.p1  ORF type:complete len:694 (+),score=104.71 GFKZ01012470.1:141-2222(+)